MRKSTFLKLALMLVAIFIFASTYAQTNAGAGVPGAATVTFTTGGTVTMVAGTTVPLYALPDPVYHSAWTYGGPWTLTAGFTWSWSVTTGNAAHFSFAPGAANVADNYVEISALPAATGAYVISVTEQASAAYGSCTGVATTQAITVVATPDATLGGTLASGGSYCAGSVPANTINATITGGFQAYRLVWSLEIATLGGAGVTADEWFDTDKTTSLGGALAYAENYTAAAPQAVAASGAHNITSIAGGFTVINNLPTLYTYTLTSINDQALRLGDYITLAGDASDPSLFTYNPIAETYTIQVNPAPTTGPIYHIPTTWAN